MTLEHFADPVLVITAHPDDIEAHCAGTVAQLVQHGKHVNYVLATSGNRGTSDTTMTAERLAELREAEQQAAAAVVGVRQVTFLRYDDGDLAFHVPQLRADLTRLIRQYQPRTIITHDPFPGNGSHDACSIYPDHTTVGMTAFQAAYLRAPSPLCEPEQVVEGLSLHKPDMLMLIMSSQPTLFVDIEPVFERRMEALSHHTTQGRHRPEVRPFFYQVAERLGTQGAMCWRKGSGSCRRRR